MSIVQRLCVLIVSTAIGLPTRAQSKISIVPMQKQVEWVFHKDSTCYIMLTVTNNTDSVISVPPRVADAVPFEIMRNYQIGTYLTQKKKRVEKNIEKYSIDYLLFPEARTLAPGKSTKVKASFVSWSFRKKGIYKVQFYIKPGDMFSSTFTDGNSVMIVVK